jgi:hypothetical protein
MNSKKIIVPGGSQGATKVTALLSNLSTEKLYSVDVREYRPKRSLEQNRTYWMWMRELANFVVNSTGQIVSDDDMHEMMKDKFLHTKVIEMGGEAFRISRSTTDQSVDEMSDYMSKIDMWAANDLGCLLTSPEEWV